MRSVITLAVFSLFLCRGVAANAADHKDYFKEVDVHTDVIYGHKYALAMTLDVLQPKKGNGAGVVWIVSGAWHSGVFPPEAGFSSTYPYAAFFDCRALLDKGFAVFFVRHGDGSRFLLPEIVDDVRRSIRFLRLNAKKYGVDPERLGALGGSAGGHLALMLAAAADDGVPNPKDYDWMLPPAIASQLLSRITRPPTFALGLSPASGKTMRPFALIRSWRESIRRLCWSRRKAPRSHGSRRQGRRRADMAQREDAGRVQEE